MTAAKIMSAVGKEPMVALSNLLEGSHGSHAASANGWRTSGYGVSAVGIAVAALTQLRMNDVVPAGS